MIFEFRIHKYDLFCKEVQIIITRTSRMAKIGPRSSKTPLSPDLLAETGDEDLEGLIRPSMAL